MTDYVVFFRDGSSVVVQATGHFDARQIAHKLFPHKRVSSSQRAHRVCG